MPIEAQQMPEGLKKFLFGLEWLEVDSTHHAAAMYNHAKGECYFRFKNGQVATVENFTMAEAIGYWMAGSKGEYYWTVVNIRGPGNKGKTRKPFHYGLG